MNGRGGLSEATGNEFFSKIKMNHSISVKMTWSLFPRSELGTLPNMRY